MRQIIPLLLTAATSFLLGLMIGRNSAPEQPISKASVPTTETRTLGSQNYNFYKELPKGETRLLGSGINSSDHLSGSTSSIATSTGETVAVNPAETEEVKSSTPEENTAHEEGESSWILQASSTPREIDAQNLSKRLRGKGYKSEVKPVTLNGKIWFRVYIGPYNSAAAAKEAASKLTRQEGLAPIARRI